MNDNPTLTGILGTTTSFTGFMVSMCRTVNLKKIGELHHLHLMKQLLKHIKNLESHYRK